MPTLSDRVLSLEHQADAILDGAKAKSQGLAKEAEAQENAIRAELSASTATRLEAFRAEAQRRHEAELRAADDEAAQALAALDRIDPTLVDQLAAEVVARLREV